MKTKIKKEYENIFKKGNQILKKIIKIQKSQETVKKKEAFCYAAQFRNKSLKKERDQYKGFFLKDFLIKNPDKIKWIDGYTRFSGWGFFYDNNQWVSIQCGQFKQGELSYGFEDTDVVLDEVGEPIDLNKNEERVYLGQFKEGKRHGFGTSSIFGETFYSGQFENGKKHGYGVRIRTPKNKNIEYFLHSHESYWGYFDQNKPSGLGAIINEENEDIIFGMFKHNYVDVYLEKINRKQKIFEIPKKIEAKNKLKKLKDFEDKELFTF